MEHETCGRCSWGEISDNECHEPAIDDSDRLCSYHKGVFEILDLLGMID